MMMQLKVKQFFQIIHDIIGNNEINKCFYVDLDFKSESFPFKPLDTSHPSLIDTFLQNCGISKSILMPLCKKE